MVIVALVCAMGMGLSSMVTTAMRANNEEVQNPRATPRSPIAESPQEVFAAAVSAVSAGNLKAAELPSAGAFKAAELTNLPQVSTVVSKIAQQHRLAFENHKATGAELLAKMNAKLQPDSRPAPLPMDHDPGVTVEPLALPVEPAAMEIPAAASRGAPPPEVPQLPTTTTADVVWTEAQTPVKPLWGLKHKSSGDAVFGLAFGYGVQEYKRFVGSLRKTGYQDDIVLATSTDDKMKPGVANYLRNQRVLSYPFGFECRKKQSRARRHLMATPAGCILTDWYEGGDTRGPRPLALIRYEHYRTWLDMYSESSWILILDFRDTFFQRNPFSPAILDRSLPVDLHLFEENRDVKRIGICPFNSGWLACWGRHMPKQYANNSVVCSGSTLGHKNAVVTYTDRMIAEFDSQQCHVSRGTESDQGYHNYLHHTGALVAKGLRVRSNPQGTGPVNTVGAMNGYRVPKDKKGPLGTFWKIRDAEGYILNWDGSRSATVHQWDRFAKELLKWVDATVAA